MAKRIDPNSLTIDAKKILEKASIQDRRDILANPAAQSFLAKLTPTEYAKLFPFARQLPDIGKAMSGGTTTAPGGGTISPPGVGAAPSATPTPSGKGAVPSAPQYVKPQASSNAQQNSFLEFLNRMSGKSNNVPSIGGGGFVGRLSAYSPKRGGDRMEGGYESSKKGPDGKNLVRTLADYASGASSYITLAGNPSQYGKTYIIPEISFVDKDGNQKTLNNVRAVVHDTGGAFKGAGTDRFDIPIDKDASNRIMNLNHSLWKQQNVRFLPQEQQQYQPEATQVPQHQQPGGTQSSAPTGLRPGTAPQQPEQVAPIVAAGKALKDIGLRVSEHPEFGGVEPVHKGRGHYEGRAFDLNVGKGMTEAEDKTFGPIFDKISSWAKSHGYNVIWRSSGHYNHMHIEAPDGMANRPHFTKTEINQLINQFSPEEREAWKKQMGVDLNEYVKSETQDLQASDNGVKKPSEYDSWNPNLKKYIENLPPSVQQQIFQKAEELKQNGQDINTYFDTYAKTNNVPMQAAAQATATAIIDSPPGELPPVNPEGFGVGVIHGQRMTKEAMKQEAQREDYTTGKIKFTGFDDKDLSAAEFQAGSGNRRGEGFPSIPSGTFSLSPQKTGPVISNYLSRHGISPTGAFGQVYNVGLPQSPTSTGYDPKTGRSREQIQIHSNVTKDIDKLVSSGCLTVSPEEYPRLVENIERARKASKSGISLVVQNNPDGTSSFTIMPSARATNPITVNTAVKNFQQTGNISGVQTQPPQQQTGTPPTEVLQHNQPVGTQSSAPTGLRREVTPIAPVPTPTTAAPPAPVQQAPTMAAPPAPAPVQQAPPPQENQVKPNAVGGQEQTTENIGFYDTNTGKTLGTVSRGEVVAVNQSGVADIKPEPRIGEIPQMRQDYQQNNPEPPKSAIAENSASMRNEATPMPQPTSIVATSQGLFGGISQSSSPDNFFISESYKRAMAAYNRFQTTDRKINPGFDTLFG